MTESAVFTIVCVPIGEYEHEDHPTLKADIEARRVADLLAELGGAPEPWDLPAGERHRTNVDRRLSAWSAPGRARNSVMFWVGHGKSDDQDAWLATYDSSPYGSSGFGPEALAGHIRDEWGWRQSEDGAWTIVVIEACGAKRFAELLTSVLTSRPNVPTRLALIGASSNGSGHLGEFASALSGAIRSYTDNDENIRLDDLVGRVRGRLHEGWVHDVALHQARPFLRRRLLPGTVTAPVDIYVELQAFLKELSPDERGHFIPKAQGAEQGELAWYFVGRGVERGRIAAWLRSRGSGMLIVTGRAGSGKSALLGNVLVHTNPALRDLLTTAGHLETIPDEQRPPDRVFDAVVHLTGMTTGELVRRLSEAADLQGVPAAESGRDVETLLAGLSDRPFTLLVDALDEAQEPAAIASSVLRRIAALPEGRVVIGTRRSTKEGPDQPDTQDEDLIDALGRASTTETIEVGRDPDAIATYIRRRLSAARIPEPTIDRVADLVRAQPRHFLFARLAVHELLAQPDLLVPDRAVDLAALLTRDHRALFAAAVDRLAVAAPVNLGLLEALALAQGRGLPRADRIWAIVTSALADNLPVLETDIDNLLAAAAPYVMLDTEDSQSVYRLSHATFREHFLARCEP